VKAPVLLALIGAVAGGASLAALWRFDLASAGVEIAAAEPPAVRAPASSAASPAGSAPPPAVNDPRRAVPSRGAAAPINAATAPRAPTAEALLEEVARRAYARVGGAIVDELVAHGLAQSDAERAVRRLFDGSARCLFDALRSEAQATSVAYDSLLDALDAELHDADGAPLAALIGLTAVQARAAPCGLTVAEQAGIPPSVMTAAARAVQR
jgi:hypothetical protein